MLRPILLLLGVVLALLGMLWIGQGLGYIRWPASSFMILQAIWVSRGSVTAVIGLVLVLIARRLPRR
jgi:hypothetical protein